MHDEDEDSSEADAGLVPDGSSLRTSTAFHEYFLQSGKVSRTSSNVFSALVPSLSSHEYADAIARATSAQSLHLQWHGDQFRRYMSCFLLELTEGFNLLFYGAGSKRTTLNLLAEHASARNGHVVVVNGFNPHFTVKDLLHSIEAIPELQSYPEPDAGPGSQLLRICNFFSSPQSRPQHLFIIIHNIDAPAFRTSKAQACLASLSRAPHIHIAASVDDISSPLLWSLTESFTRKATSLPHTSAPSSKGCGWLWHDLTTLAPYDFELSFADRSSFSGASRVASKAQRANAGATGGSASAPMTEIAAQHILAAVTHKAKKLFQLLGAKQLQLMDELDIATVDPQQLAFDYSMLFNMARDNFVATNDTALRALMGEFRDHGLMVSNTNSSGGEMVWIPMRKDALSKILNELSQLSQ